MVFQEKTLKPNPMRQKPLKQSHHYGLPRRTLKPKPYEAKTLKKSLDRTVYPPGLSNLHLGHSCPKPHFTAEVQSLGFRGLRLQGLMKGFSV